MPKSTSLVRAVTSIIQMYLLPACVSFHFVPIRELLLFFSNLNSHPNTLRQSLFPQQVIPLPRFISRTRPQDGRLRVPYIFYGIFCNKDLRAVSPRKVSSHLRRFRNLHDLFFPRFPHPSEALRHLPYYGKPSMP